MWRASLAGEFAADNKVRIVANVGLEHNPDPESNAVPAFALGGLIYSVTKSVDLDAGYKMNLNGPGEEIFWRGFLQSKMMERFGKLPGYIIATCIYAAVHVFSGNIILIGAALVAGVFWGAMYMQRRDLFMQIVSHSLWSSFIFAVTPITPAIN